MQGIIIIIIIIKLRPRNGLGVRLKVGCRIGWGANPPAPTTHHGWGGPWPAPPTGFASASTPFPVSSHRNDVTGTLGGVLVEFGHDLVAFCAFHSKLCESSEQVAVQGACSAKGDR